MDAYAHCSHVNTVNTSHLTMMNPISPHVPLASHSTTQSRPGGGVPFRGFHPLRRLTKSRPGILLAHYGVLGLRLILDTLALRELQGEDG